jgi:hypothetical protein
MPNIAKVSPKDTGQTRYVKQAAKIPFPKASQKRIDPSAFCLPSGSKSV